MAIETTRASKDNIYTPRIVGGVEANSINGLARNPRKLDHNGDEILVYSGRSFLDHRDSLVTLTSGFMSTELGWSLPVALRTIDRGLTVTEADRANPKLIPSVVVFTRGGEIIGVSVQRYIDIDTDIAGPVPFLQHLLRAFKERYRGRGRGRFSVQLAQTLHDDAEYYGHRTHNPIALYANQKSEIFVPGGYLPPDALYNTNPKSQEIMVRYYLRTRVNTTGSVDFTTGVSKEDFPEPNMSYLPNPKHAPTMELLRRMQEEWGMEFPGRDALHAVGRLR